MQPKCCNEPKVPTTNAKMSYCLRKQTTPNILHVGWNPFQKRSQHRENRLLPSSCTSVCPSILPFAWNNLAPTGRIFVKFYVWVSFSKLFRETSSIIKIWQQELHINTYMHLYLAAVFLEWEMFRTELVQKIKTHIVCSMNFFPQKSRRLR